MEDISYGIIASIITASGGVIISLGVFMIKKVLERVQRLEERSHSTADRDEMRDVILDQVKPLRKQIDKIDNKLDKIIDFIMNK